MPLDFAVNIAYQDLYEDIDAVDIDLLLSRIPTKMALTLIAHYTGQIHTIEKKRTKAIFNYFRMEFQIFRDN